MGGKGGDNKNKKGKKGKSNKGKSQATDDKDKVKPSAAAVSAPLTFTSYENLTVKLGAKGLERFNLTGLLELTVANIGIGKFKIKTENQGPPGIKFSPDTSIDRGIFSQKNLLGIVGRDKPFPAGQSRPLHWSLNIKDESNVPIKINCETSAVGEQTKIMIKYNAFSHFNLENVHISIPINSGEAPIDKVAEVGRCWYDPGKTKEQSRVHWSILAIDDSNRNGSIKFFVPGALNVSQCFPIYVKFKANATYSNLHLTIVPFKKQNAPPEFLHHTQLVAQDYKIEG